MGKVTFTVCGTGYSPVNMVDTHLCFSITTAAQVQQLDAQLGALIAAGLRFTVPPTLALSSG